MDKSFGKIGLAFLVIIAFIGLTLRAIPILRLDLNFGYLLHAHSHVAFQGWIYTLIFSIVTKLFIPDDLYSSGKYKLQYLITLFVIVGVLFSFSLQGYAAISICFSTLFQLLNYWFIYRLLKDLSLIHKGIYPLSVRFLRIGMLLGVLSTAGPWMIAILSINGLQGTEIYQSAILFFLHFQYNGWFYFCAFAIFFRYLERNGPLTSHALQLFRVCVWTVIPTYILSLIHFSYGRWLLAPGILIVIIQLLIPYLLLKINRSISILDLFVNSNTKLILKLIFIIILIKSITQFGSLLPGFDIFSFYNRFTQIFFIHLILIGILTFFFLSILFEEQVIPQSRISNIGIYMVIGGFLFSEMFILLTGLGLGNYSLTIFISSALLFLGIVLLFYSSIKKKQSLF